ncbi:MAG: NADPH-dependent FMN reductase [Bacteroidota bacterium]
MQLIAISGSARPESNNHKLLRAIAKRKPDWAIGISRLPEKLPLFRAQDDGNPLPATVIAWRHALAAADGLIISSPEYAHNLPAILKNALEWLVSSGELAAKPVLPIILTPHAPRGEKAMQSLCWTLASMNARILVQLPLYQDQIQWGEEGQMQNGESLDMLDAALDLFSA